MQECLIEWHLKRGKYDPTRGASKQTFMARIVRNKLADIANKRKTKKRGAGRDHISLDDKVGGNEDSPHLIDTIASESSNASHFESPDEVLMKGAVSTVVAKLTERQQLIVRHLRESHSVSEIGRLINTPRTTVNDEIGRIRRLFHKEQLDSFLV
jgi:DNA-directed RNA polymerase specialized sigma24 family protein